MTIALSPAPATTAIISWIDADSVEHEFSESTGYIVLEGEHGAWMPPIALTSDPLPFQAGSRLRQVRTAARQLDELILVKAATPEQLVDRLRDLMRWMDPHDGDGYLRVTRESEARQLACRYVSGLELDRSPGNVGPDWQQLVLTLEAFDPYWQDVDAMLVSSTIDDAPIPWFDRDWFGGPWFSSAAVFRRFNVTNDGDAPAWPVWTITGPGTTPVLRNVTSGKHLQSSVVLGATDQMIIDTRPNQKTVNDGAGSNLFHTLTATSELFPIELGFNTIEIGFNTATTTDDTLVDLSYRRNFFGP